MTVSLENSMKKRLQHIAKERNTTAAEVWQNVILERFLMRLCKSSYRSNFILKGGVLLAKHIDIGRETKDLDFLVENLANDTKILTQALEEIASLSIDDGFEFKNVKIESLSHFHMQYPGAQIRIEALFGKSRYSFFIDLGFKDHVNVKEEDIVLIRNSNGPLFEETVSLKCYPMAFVFAEKLETVVFRGADNTRMKDFHDLLSMVNAGDMLDKQETHNAIKAVFEHRGTVLQLPIHFDDAAIATLQKNWQRYRPSIALPESLPKHIQEVISTIHSWLCFPEL